jgi:hypothetical protein
MAALNAFDPYVFPFVGVTAALAQLENQEKSLGRPDSSEGAPTPAHSRPDYRRTRSSALMYEIKCAETGVRFVRTFRQRPDPEQWLDVMSAARIPL